MQRYASELKMTRPSTHIVHSSHQLNTLLQPTLEQKDLEVWTTPSMTFTVLYHQSASKANEGLIRYDQI